MFARRIISEVTGYNAGMEWFQNKQLVHKGILSEKDLDPFQELEVLATQDRAKVMETIQKITDRYDSDVDAFTSDYPKFSDTVWQGFRKTSGKVASFPTLAETMKMKTKDGIPENVRKEVLDRFIELLGSDDTLCKEYNAYLNGFSDSEDATVLQDLLKHDPDYMFGLGRYVFDMTDGRPMTCFWDLRQETLPKFNFLIYQTPVSDMASTVQEEIDQYDKDHPDCVFPGFEETDDHVSYYLNNFFMSVARIKGRRKLDPYFELDKGDTPFSELIGEGDSGSPKPSELYLGRTPRQMRSDIDKATRKCAVDVSAIGAMVEDSHEHQRPVPMKQIAQMVLPAYIHLRAMGYEKHDLTP